MAPYYVVDVYARDESKGGNVKFGRETVYAGYNYRASLCDKLHSSTIDSSSHDATAPITSRLLTHLHTPFPHRSTRRFASPPVIDAVMMPLKTAQKIASMKLLNYHPPSETYASKSAPNANTRATKNAGATASITYSVKKTTLTMLPIYAMSYTVMSASFRCGISGYDSPQSSSSPAVSCAVNHALVDGGVEEAVEFFIGKFLAGRAGYLRSVGFGRSVGYGDVVVANAALKFLIGASRWAISRLPMLLAAAVSVGVFRMVLLPRYWESKSWEYDAMYKEFYRGGCETGFEFVDVRGMRGMDRAYCEWLDGVKYKKYSSGSGGSSSDSDSGWRSRNSNFRKESKSRSSSNDDDDVSWEEISRSAVYEFFESFKRGFAGGGHGGGAWGNGGDGRGWEGGYYNESSSSSSSSSSSRKSSSSRSSRSSSSSGGGRKSKINRTYSGYEFDFDVTCPRSILNLPKTGPLTKVQVRNAFRKEILLWHPDRMVGRDGKGRGEARAKLVVWAYKELRKGV